MISLIFYRKLIVTLCMTNQIFKINNLSNKIILVSFKNMATPYTLISEKIKEHNRCVLKNFVQIQINNNMFLKRITAFDIWIVRFLSPKITLEQALFGI